MTVEKARRKLANRRLAGLVQTYIDGGRPGEVVAQFPHAGLAATRNMTVRLVVSRG
jgi:beta-lactam-binding protein with PASTA domain